jgi:hypothetical protein
VSLYGAAPALEALAALCRFALEDTSADRHGLAPCGGTSLPQETQAALLSRLLSAPPDDPARDATSDALLPAILAAPDAWQALQAQLIERAGAGGGAADANRAATALQALTAANGLTRSLDRLNRRRFRANVAAFAADVRGLLRVQ